MIFYFSGTGNTMWAANYLAEKLNDNAVSILQFKDAEEVVCNDDTIGFLYPVYGSDCPRVYREFLMKLKCKPDVYAYNVETLNKVDFGSANSVDKALCNSGAGLSYTAWLYMPGNCMVTDEKTLKNRLATAAERLDAIAVKIQHKVVNFKTRGEKTPDTFLDLSPMETSLSRFEIKDTCNGCGICANVCPTGNISIVDGKAVHGTDCTLCLACFHWCPEKAVKMCSGFRELDERDQYTHPEISVKDIIGQKK